MTPLPNPEDLNYEQSVRELEDVIAALEMTQVSLEESLALYERGQEYSVYCTKLLDEAELKVQQVEAA